MQSRNEYHVPEVAPGAAEAADAYRALEPYLPESAKQARKIDVLVSKAEGRRTNKFVKCHVCTTTLPRGSVQATSLRGYDILATSPELTFVQIAASEDLRIAAYVGMALCSSFRIDEYASSGLEKRVDQEEPLTSVKKIAAYLRHAKGGLRGRRGTTRSEIRLRRGALAARGSHRAARKATMHMRWVRVAGCAS